MSQPNQIKTGTVVRLAQQGNPDVFPDGKQNCFTVAGSEQVEGRTFYRLREIDGLFLADSFAWKLTQPNPAPESTDPHFLDFLHTNPLPGESGEHLRLAEAIAAIESIHGVCFFAAQSDAQIRFMVSGSDVEVGKGRTHEAAIRDAYSRLPKPTEQPQAPQRPIVPSKFCRILENDNPDFDERFACKDCGENFITMCSYARVKAQLAAALEREKERDAERLSWADLAGDYAQRAEEAEAELTRVKAERDRLRGLLDEAISRLEDSKAVANNVMAERLRAALTPPPAKEQP